LAVLASEDVCHWRCVVMCETTDDLVASLRSAFGAEDTGSVVLPRFRLWWGIAASASAWVEHQRQSGGKRGSRARSPIKGDQSQQVWRVDGSWVLLGAHGFDGLVSPIWPSRIIPRATPRASTYQQGEGEIAGRISRVSMAKRYVIGEWDTRVPPNTAGIGPTGRRSGSGSHRRPPPFPATARRAMDDPSPWRAVANVLSPVHLPLK
jgi:hypothetical protein